jgi:hypothetical protein
MLPGRFNRLPHHVYKANGAEVLKLNAMYGANGAGKSNLIKAFSLLREYLSTGELPIEFIIETFKFQEAYQQSEVYFGVEFIKENIPYYYGLTIKQGVIVEEELEISGLAKGESIPLFNRKDDAGNPNLQLDFYNHLNNDKEASLFPDFLKNEMLERNKPVLFFMKNRKNEAFMRYKQALEWFTKDIIPITPNIKPSGLPIHLENDKNFRDFANSTMQSFKTGIQSLQVDTIPIEEFFGEDNREEAERISSELRANPGKVRPFVTEHEEIMFVSQKGKIVAKRLSFIHEEAGKKMKFLPYEESDGTRRLLDYLPALYTAINSKRIILVDEIERSIHPLLIKELIQKFSHDAATKGQLIFSTHESNLLDQEIFRPDEIWFAEKNKEGATEVYPLSDFKEHHTIDIRKGYLNGRYGAIPFVGNLRDLNRDKYAKAN